MQNEPLAWIVESTHSGDVLVRELFDTEEVARLHATTNGGVVVPLVRQRAEGEAQINACGQDRLWVSMSVARCITIHVDDRVPEGTVEIRDYGPQGPRTGRLLGKIINVGSV